ncbi:MAG: penicillin-binding protein 1C [Spirochaetota bacterium]
MDRNQIRLGVESIRAAWQWKLSRCLCYALLAFLSVKFLAWVVLPIPLFATPYSYVLLSKEKKLLAARIAIDEQWRFPCCIPIPRKYKQALLAFEDRRFYWHPGIDPIAIARAFLLNIRRGRIVSGGSTLTMQMVRLWQRNPKRTFLAKLLEMCLSLLVELRFSKEEIMQLYMTHAPFGGNIVGLETAAWRYFRRSPETLSWAESALLAVLPNSPALIHPGRNRVTLRKKRNRLLRVLQERGILGKTDLQLALVEPLPEKPVPLPRLAPHLLDTLILQGNASENKQLSRFTSTTKFYLQQKVDGIVNRHGERLAAQRIGNAAALVVNNRSGEILAYIGNRRAGSSGASGLAVDLIHRPRSTGSILKPFLFAAMLKDGEILSETLVPDVPVRYRGFKPNNYDRKFRGAIPAKLALARSLNIPAVHMLHQYGVQRFYAVLQSSGMTSLFRSYDEYGLSLVLGGAEGLLFDITQMYANLAAEAKGRKRMHLHWLAGQSRTKIIEKSFGTAAAYLTLDALLEVTRPNLDHFWRNFRSSKKIAWKTGTSYGLRDAWAIGVTPKYTVGVWAGNANGEGVAGLSGVSSAAPILFDIFRILDDSSWFATPWKQLTEFQVCKDNGLLPSAPCELQRVLAPLGVSFTRQSTQHKLLHLDKERKWQVHADCENTTNMRHETWFVLPPVQAFYYKKFHPEYKSPPPFRPDCRRETTQPITLIYPTATSKILIPRNLKGELDAAVLQAVHVIPDTEIFWHLNDTYVGKTKTFHQISIQPKAGTYKLTLVDEHGNRLERSFEVLDIERKN